MRLIEAEIPPNCDIAAFGDEHLGNAARSESGVREVIHWITAGRNRRFIYTGDGIEAITTDDPRFQWQPPKPGQPEAPLLPLQQEEALIAEYRKVSKRGLAWLSGNHEFALHRIGDFGDRISRSLGIPYGGVACRISLRDKHGPIALIYACHPSRLTIRSNAKDYEQRKANMQAQVKRFLVDKASDCAVMLVGHVHKLIVVPPSGKLIIYQADGKLKQGYLDGDNSMPRYIDPDRRWYAATGSFLRTMTLDHDGYAERWGLDPVELGYPVITIRDRKIVSVTPRYVD
jgi:hypothetical protein